MVGRIFLGPVCAIGVCLGALSQPVADTSPPGLAALQAWERDWTVLTMSPDGAWGVGTDMWMIAALSRAMSHCQAMSRREIGCGAYWTNIQAGWSLGLRCGDKNIVMAEATLDDALRRASWREFELRKLHDPDMPPCVRLVTVDPNGAVVSPNERGTRGRRTER